MASNSKPLSDNATKFTEAKNNWNLEKLYEDLRAAKQKLLTDTEKCHLRGLLCNHSPQTIADERVVSVGTVNDALSKTLYSYIKTLLNLNSEEKITHWSNVPNLLAKAGYKIQLSEQTTPNPLDLAEHEKAIAKPPQESVETYAGSIEERIFKATNQLDPERPMFSRMSAIQALGEIAKDYSRYQWNIMEILAAFVRNNAPRKEEEEGEEEQFPKISEDIQAALTVIGRRDWNLPIQALDLSNTDLRGANLSGYNLIKVNFNKANLEGVNLNGADLESARLFKTVLSNKADLSGVCLEKAILMETDLSLASLKRANLKGARLDKAKLKEADLSGANLSESHLNNADLEGVKLTSVKSVSVAKPNQMKVTEVNMEGAKLQGANVKGVNFSEVKNLDLEQLSLADGDSTTVLPNDIERPVHWL